MFRSSQNGAYRRSSFIEEAINRAHSFVGTRLENTRNASAISLTNDDKVSAKPSMHAITGQLQGAVLLRS